GLANLVCELLLRGTRSRSRTAFQSQLEQMGATLGVRVANDRVNFSGEVIKENTLPFVAMVEDALTKPAFSRKEFAALKKEILGQIAHAKNSNGQLAALAM